MNYVIGIAVIVIGGLALELSHIRRSYETIYDLLLADRNAAREEVKTLRAALFPQLARIGAEQPLKRAQAVAASTPLSPQPPAFPSRIPFRKLFKALVAQHNSKQIARDCMAAAINKETSNVS